MAGYAFHTLQARQNLQTLWEQGTTAKDLAAALKVPLPTVYPELWRGHTGDRLPDQCLKYDAAQAQFTMQQELERRGSPADFRRGPQAVSLCGSPGEKAENKSLLSDVHGQVPAPVKEQ